MNNINLDLAKELVAVAEEKGYKLPEFEKVWVLKFPMFCDKDILTTAEEFKKRLSNSILSSEARVLVKAVSAPNTNELLEGMKDLEACVYYSLKRKAWIANAISDFHEGVGDKPEFALCKLYIHLIKNDLL